MFEKEETLNMNKALAGIAISVIIVWIIVIIPLLIAGISMLVMGIKDLKHKVRKKKTASIVCIVIGSIFTIFSSVAIIVPTIWGIDYYQKADEADKSYNKRFESQSEYPSESEEIDSEIVYLIY